MAHRILVVDDDAVSLRLIAYSLQREGLEVHTASSGADALEMVARQLIDLVILDVMMPHLDGYEVCRRLRESPNTARLPIIMLTAKSQVEDKVRGFKAGADDYVTKPVLPAELVARVQALLQRSSFSTPAEVPSRSRVIAFVGAKGGVGTTTLAVNVALAMVEQGKQVVLADLNIGAGSAALMLGLKPNDALLPLLNDDDQPLTAKSVGGALVSHTSGLKILPAPTRRDAVSVGTTTERLQQILNLLASQVEYLVLDMGAYINRSCLAGVAESDRVIVVTESDHLALDLVEQTTAALGQASTRGALVEVAMVNRGRSAAVISKSEAEGKLNNALAAYIIPASEMCFQANRNRIPIIMSQPGNVTVEQIRELAMHLMK